MSKIWKNPIIIPEEVQISLDGNLVTIKWPKGSLSFSVSDGIFISITDNILQVSCGNENLWNLRGTTRAIIAHMIYGVHIGYTKALQVIGVGFDATLQWEIIQFKLGFSHLVYFTVPNWIAVKIDKDPKGNSVITLTSHDKQLIWQTASKIRDLKRPEPYKWKWIRYLGEIIKLKAGKTAKK